MWVLCVCVRPLLNFDEKCLQCARKKEVIVAEFACLKCVFYSRKELEENRPKHNGNKFLRVMQKRLEFACVCMGMRSLSYNEISS
jgi:hypothetical protein